VGAGGARSLSVLVAFSIAAAGAGTARALTTTYLPVLLERIEDAPALIGAVMSVNAVAGFAVPLVVGLWSDRRRAAGLGRRLPFMIGGTMVAAGGLLAVALGNGSSYVVLGIAAAVLYTGLNALTTAHRALIAEDFADERRPAAASAQEIAGALGAGFAVAIGAALVEPAPAAAFALAAAVLVVAAVPTFAVVRRLRLGAGPTPRVALPARAALIATLRRPGAREVLLAQTLWVLAYAALPAFFVLYAEKELGLGLGVAGTLPLAFGVFVLVGMAIAGRVPSPRVRSALIAGAALLGAGLLSAAVSNGLAAVAVPLAAAAVGAGLLTALGFPYFARFVPVGEAGGYSGVFFASRGAAAAIALPVAGVVVELTGSYRSVLLLGGAAAVAIVPLAVADRGRSRRAIRRPRPATVAAVMPVFASARAAEMARATLRYVDELVLVDDGASPAIARSLAGLAADERVRIVGAGGRRGKGSALAAGVELLLAQPVPPDAILTIDSDGQHDPDRIPAFVEAARGADVVIGWRRDRRAMPVDRRVANRAASLALLARTRTWIPDTQNGMRLFRTDALRAVPPVRGGYEAETRHLRALLAAGRPVGRVEIPTIYDGEPSHFHPIADTVRVARALTAPLGAGTAWPVVRERTLRVGAAMAGTLVIAAALPALQQLDDQLFLAVNRLGDGPEWLYAALDPHTRNYLLLFLAAVVAAAVTHRRGRYVMGTAIAVVLAGYLAGAALEVLKLFVERGRPEELLGDQVLLSHDRSWGHIASYPSGHLIVTTAMAAAAATAAPVLRLPLAGYVAAVGFTRVLFGAHFPLDVLVGAALGYELGLLTVALLATAHLVPTVPQARAGVRAPLREPAAVPGASHR
jgi:maltose/moltooligosaccharide transporter